MKWNEIKVEDSDLNIYIKNILKYEKIRTMGGVERALLRGHLDKVAGLGVYRKQDIINYLIKIKH